MKKLFTLCFVVLFMTTNYAQQFESSILPDSLQINEPPEFTSNGSLIYTITYSGTAAFGPYYLAKTSDSGTEFIEDIPYPIIREHNTGESDFYINTNTYAMEIFDGDLYHLTKYDGIHIYKTDGTWETLEVTDNTPIEAYAILKDNDNIYLITNDHFYYYDGSSWITLAFDASIKYAKITKHNNLIYFNGAQGLYRFDGNTIELLISSSSYTDYNFFEENIWIGELSSSYSSNPILVYDINGNAIDLDFPVTINSSATFNILNDNLYILNKNYNNKNLGYIIKNGSISQVQNNFTYNYSFPYSDNNISNYENGLLVKSQNNKLILVTPSAYNAFGSVQPENNFRNLDINQVDAGYWNRGQMFWDMIAVASYEVPKGSGKTPMFASGLWFSALDINDQVHGAVAKFNENGHDFFPGPLRASGALQGTSDSIYATQFDHIWKITREEIILHQINYASNNYIIPEDIATWPAHGNIEDGYAEHLAPFIDVNENNVYEPSLGDYPDIKGDMSLYWIFNDNLDLHHESEGSTALMAEIHAQAYAFTCDTLTGMDTALNYTTFLEYRVINRSTFTYSDFSTAFWTDADLGYASDDYIGSHVGLNSMYFYNGKDMDGTGNDNTYGENPPAQFITILDAPLAENADNIDNDNDGTIDEDGEKALLRHMTYFNNGAGATGDPNLASDYFNYMHGLWRDGRSVTFGGIGYQPTGGTPAKYMFPGDSDPMMNGTNGIDPDYSVEGGWTEANEGNSPSDRRGLAVSGPFNFEPNQELEFQLAFVWSRGDDGAISSVNKGFLDVERITEMYNNGELHGCGLEDVSVNELDALETLEVFPNPVSDVFVVKGAELDSKYEILNLKGQLLSSGTLKQESINIKHLSEGTYVLKVIDSNKTKVLKIVKI